jgi:hypothetical protein
METDSLGLGRLLLVNLLAGTAAGSAQGLDNTVGCVHLPLPMTTWARAFPGSLPLLWLQVRCRATILVLSENIAAGNGKSQASSDQSGVADTCASILDAS